jgi:hypothetical protein
MQYVLQKAIQDGMLSPLRDRTARLRLSLYADDATLFIRPCRVEVDTVVEILRRFGDATGLRVNIAKSSVIPIRFAEINLDVVLHNFMGERASFPARYLVLPITLDRLRMVHLQPVLEHAATKLDGWQGCLMNWGGHRELVRTVLGAIPTYLVSAIKPPKQFHKEVDKMRRRFLWAGNQHHHGGKCKVSWARVCRPLKIGGLGIKDLERFAHALRIRWLWIRWRHPDKPWRVADLPIDGTDEALFTGATRVQIDNGKTMKFWTSSWLNGMAPAAMFPELYDHSRRKNRTVATAMTNG